MAKMTPLFTHFFSFQESNEDPPNEEGRGNSTVSKLVSSYTHTHTHTHGYTYIYISPLNRLLRKRSVPANCNSDSAGRNSRLPEILQWGDSWRKSCQAAVLMKRYRRDRVSLKISRHLAFQIRDVRGSRRGEREEREGKKFLNRPGKFSLNLVNRRMVGTGIGTDSSSYIIRAICWPTLVFLFAFD